MNPMSETVSVAKLHLPWAPLEALLQVKHLDRKDHGNQGLVHHAHHDLGMTRRTVLRYIAAGSVPFAQADELAMALGLHPAEVWGRDWWDACAAYGEYLESPLGRKNDARRLLRARQQRPLYALLRAWWVPLRQERTERIEARLRALRTPMLDQAA